MKIGETFCGLQHLGLPTGCFEKTIEFYKELGFESIFYQENKVCFLKQGSCVLEVYPFENPAMKAGAWDHIALDSKDIELSYKLCKEAGYEFEDNEGIHFLPFFDNGVKYFTIYGPNREKVEFNQML